MIGSKSKLDPKVVYQPVLIGNANPLEVESPDGTKIQWEVETVIYQEGKPKPMMVIRPPSREQENKTKEWAEGAAVYILAPTLRIVREQGKVLKIMLPSEQSLRGIKLETDIINQLQMYLAPNEYELDVWEEETDGRNN